MKLWTEAPMAKKRMKATSEKKCLAGYLDKAKQIHKIRMEIGG